MSVDGQFRPYPTHTWSYDNLRWFHMILDHFTRFLRAKRWNYWMIRNYCFRPYLSRMRTFARKTLRKSSQQCYEMFKNGVRSFWFTSLCRFLRPKRWNYWIILDSYLHSEHSLFQAWWRHRLVITDRYKNPVRYISFLFISRANTLNKQKRDVSNGFWTCDMSPGPIESPP